MNLNVRNGIILALSLFSSQVFAGCMYDTRCPYQCLNGNRFYVGGALGVSGLMDREYTNIPTRMVHYLSATGPLVGAIFGYDFCVYDRVRFELEGFANATSISISDNQDYAPQSSYTVKMRYNAGIRGMPAYDFTPQTSGHLIFGYSYGKFNIHDNGNYGFVNKMFGQNGMQFGFGMENYLSKCLLLRGDVIYTSYPVQSTNGVTTTIPPSSQIYFNNLSTLEADLALVYKL